MHLSQPNQQSLPTLCYSTPKLSIRVLWLKNGMVAIAIALFLTSISSASLPRHLKTDTRTPIRSISLPSPINPFSRPYTPATRWGWGSLSRPPLMSIRSLCIVASNYYPLVRRIQSSTTAHFSKDTPRLDTPFGDYGNLGSMF